MTPEERYARQVADILDGFAYEYCEECGGDAEGHMISPDPLGNAHAWCQYANGPEVTS
jgi:hypothetical protein